MSPRPVPGKLSQDDWQHLDDLLDELLELDQSTREARLHQLEQSDPDTAARLRNLLNDSIDEHRLDGHLTSVLSYLAGQETPEPDTRIGAWRLLRPIGRGGMAEVYLAERADGAFERQVALKLLWPGLVSRDADRFVRQERQILADLDDPRVAGLVDGGLTDDGRPWLAMEYVDGEPIDRACREHNIDLPGRIRLFIEVAEAVATAHRQLVVHGDIKPANVLVTANGQIKLLDFGIGRLLDEHRDNNGDAQGWKALTPGWASPEQKRGLPPSPATDIYQLGLLLRTLIEDIPPAGRRHRELEAILARALDPDPKRRYPGADRLAAELDDSLAHRPVDALRGGLAYRAQCLIRRRWPALTLAAVLMVAGVTLFLHELQQTRVLAERNAANEAVLAYLEEMLNRSNPQQRGTDRPSASEDLLADAAAGLEQRLGDQPRARARVLNTLGRIHQDRNENVLAGRRHAEALALARDHDFPDVLDAALEGLAVVGIWGGDYARSEEYLRELITLRQRTGRPLEDLDRARLQLADLLHSRGKYDAALEQARAAHAGNHNPAWSWRVLGMILRDQGLFTDAEQAFAASHSIETSRPAPAAPRLAELSDHRALLMLHQGDVRAARQALDQSAALRRSYLGEDWDGLVWTRHWYAQHALATGNLERAASLLDVQLIDYQRFLGESSHLLAYARSDRAYAALGLGDIDTAQRLFELAAQRLETMHDGDHPRLAEMLLGQALIALAEGRLDAARRSSERALAIRERLPPDSDGANIWRANACHIATSAGGRCTSPDIENGRGNLDTARLQVARRGLCQTQARQARPALPDTLCSRLATGL